MSLPAPLRVLTYNIRFDNPDDPFPWSQRRTGVANLLRSKAPDVFGLQEVLAHQLSDLAEALPEYAYVGAGRGPNPNEKTSYTPSSGEHNPVFYRRERLKPIDSGTFWLSSTPDKPGSQFEHTSFPRIATWAKFGDNHTGKSFYFFNTHFPFEADAGGVAARASSAEVLLTQVERIAREEPTIVTGDFNLSADHEVDHLQAYATLRGHFDDAFYAAAPHQGPEATYFGFEVTNPGEHRIDYLFTSRAHDLPILFYETVTDSNGVYYFSDHLPVVAELLL